MTDSTYFTVVIRTANHDRPLVASFNEESVDRAVQRTEGLVPDDQEIVSIDARPHDLFDDVPP